MTEPRSAARACLLALGALAAFLSAGPAAAAYPEKPIRLIVPFSAGGTVDVVARIVAAKAATLLGGSIVVENVPGAGGVIATEQTVKSAPDGYTLLFTTPNHTVNPGLFPKLRFDTERDLAPIAMIAEIPELFIANSAQPFDTFQGFVDYARKNPGKLNYASAGNGTLPHVTTEMMLRELKLDVHADKRITSLSGGQRKRVSVALELLTKPSLIFLDEPTSGLDPGMDRDVMQLLRGLADDGRTVLVVTHSVAELSLCDRLLVMAPGGAVAYFGPPDEALTFFGYETWADVFQAFENYRDYDWSGRWRGSQHYQMYAADLDAAPPQAAAPVAPRQSRPPKAQSWGSQLRTLMARYLSVIASDRGFMGLMLILPAVLGVVSVVIPAKYGLAPGPDKGIGFFWNKDAGTILMILTVGACFSGAANSVRELIKERVIYERERAVGLSRSAYLMSKVIVLGLITAVQGVIICSIGFAPRKMPVEGVLFHNNPAIEMTLVVIGIGFTSMMFGLVISSLVKTAEKTMPLLVMFAIVQVVFTGILFQLFGKPGIEQVAWLMPSRWALAGLATTADLNHLMPWDPPTPGHAGSMDTLWKHSAGIWFLDMAVLLAIGAVCGLAVARLLRRHEPEVMRES